MELRVLNTSLIAIDIIDSVDSLIWVERYQDVGEFEIYVEYTRYYEEVLQPGYYLITPDSQRAMIIENVTISTDPEKGNKLIVSGRSLESILDRRIILQQTILDTDVQSAIDTILSENVIASSQPVRNIPNFIFSASVDPAITGTTLEAQYDTQEVLEVIRTLCVQADIGFKLVFNASMQFVFSLYVGTNRSYTQSTNPYVVFSPNFDNLIKSDFFRTIKPLKTYALILGDKTNGDPHRVETISLGATGLERREMFVDASDISKYIEGTEVEIDSVVYQTQLSQRGQEHLAVQKEFTLFEGQIDTNNVFRYGVDFQLGDIVQMVDEFGHVAVTQVMEMTFSENLSGSTVYPTLRTI